MSQSGARIWLNDAIDTTVTMEFQNAPIREGVLRILKGKNYAFLYAPNEIKEGKLSIISASKSKEEPPKKPPKKPVQPVAKKTSQKKKNLPLKPLLKMLWRTNMQPREKMRLLP